MTVRNINGPHYKDANKKGNEMERDKLEAVLGHIEAIRYVLKCKTEAELLKAIKAAIKQGGEAAE